MLTILLLGTALLSKTTGLPSSSRISSLGYPSLLAELEAQQQCVCPDTRSLLDIIWSCLSTMFLCTWVAVHPNMPGKGEYILKTILRRVKMMFCALIAPEMVLVFAMRQWLSARAISNEYKNRGWTMTHGFFLIMGGLVLRKGEEDLGIISYDLFRQLDEAGDIEFPSVTREEIEDKSKGDVLSKGLVILQTLWFTVQCIARGVRGLALTELEMVTLAFCSLNAVMYFMWWHKPLDVQHTIPVFLKPGSDYVHKFDLKRAVAMQSLSEGAQSLDTPKPDINTANKPLFPLHLLRFGRPLRYTFTNLKNKIQRHISNLRKDWQGDLETYGPVFILPIWMGYIIFFVIVGPPLFALILFLEILGMENDTLPPGRNRVRSFYSPILERGSVDSVIVIYGVTGAIFGGIHLIAWNFAFPTHTDTMIWRYTSLSITFMPLMLLCSSIMTRPLEGITKAGLPRQEGFTGALLKGRYYLCCMLSYFFICSSFVPLLFYFPARMILFFEAFYLLRRLPASALLDVDWQNFIPHL